jgi:hypothetical protein
MERFAPSRWKRRSNQGGGFEPIFVRLFNENNKILFKVYPGPYGNFFSPEPHGNSIVWLIGTYRGSTLSHAQVTVENGGLAQ